MRPRDARFWRNAALVAVVHLVVFLALARGSREATPTNLQTVVWMNSEVSAASEPKTAPAPSPTPVEIAEPAPSVVVAKSEIQMPSPTPTPTIAPKPTVTPKPSATPTPKSSPKPTAKPTPKATAKKSAEPKETPKPAKEKDEKKSTTAKKDSSTSSNQTVEKSDSSKGSGTGTTQASEYAWYGTMLHDRFHKAWEQPKSIVATGAKMSAIVKIRIEKDGRVTKFTIVKPSGNVAVDESVAAIAQRVTQVDPLPEGLTQKSYYEVKIDFELNAEK
ncbi:MAG TPA: TonB family protein [Chthoniobacterales bacterium]|nr:TonB family protein [Chthoniobacterales bacterium]